MAAAAPWHVFSLLLSLRIVNSLVIRTFFQPDEYFQSLEPAWRLAFGGDSGAWITWEWRNGLRSSLHPFMFAFVYRAASTLSDFCSFSAETRSAMLLATPKVAQAMFAACIDYFTWSLARKLHGPHSRVAWTTLLLSACSPWQFFCSVRTLSNSVETALTAAALFFWPWQSISKWTLSPSDVKSKKKSKANHPGYLVRPSFGPRIELRISLLLAALGTILRPTNILIWIPLALRTLWQSPAEGPRLATDALFSGCFVLLLSVLADRSYYGAWTFPPFRFLHFNIAQSLAVFYGKNRWDYYLTEGIPLLLTTSLPFAVIGIYRQTFRAFTTGRGISLDSVAATATSTLGWVTVFMTVCLSLISHKEIRFLYPALPALHLISASPLSNFTKSPSRFKKLLIAVLFSVNLLIGVYLTQIHQRGVLDVLRYLRSQHESRFQIQTGQDAGIMTVAFLMPCHSTPWRSHLIYPSIDAWALTCEPPLHVPLRQREGYLDEADQFYADPAAWFKVHMGDSDSFAKGQAKHAARNDLRTASSGAATLQPAFHDDSGIVKRRAWPNYLVFFEQLEPTMKAVLHENDRYKECWRGFNTHWHDDWRRKGDVVVWCTK